MKVLRLIQTENIEVLSRIINVIVWGNLLTGTGDKNLELFLNRLVNCLNSVTSLLKFAGSTINRKSHKTINPKWIDNIHNTKKVVALRL